MNTHINNNAVLWIAAEFCNESVVVCHMSSSQEFLVTLRPSSISFCMIIHSTLHHEVKCSKSAGKHIWRRRYPSCNPSTSLHNPVWHRGLAKFISGIVSRRSGEYTLAPVKHFTCLVFWHCHPWLAFGQIFLTTGMRSCAAFAEKSMIN